MAEGAIEYAAVAIAADPGEREIAVGALYAGCRQVHATGIQSKQHPYALARETEELINLLGRAEAWRHMRDDRILGILHFKSSFLRPGVAVENAADQLAVLRPGVKRIGCAMRPTEAFALSHEIQQLGLLAIGKRQFATCKKINCVEAAESFSVDQRNVFGVDDFQNAGLPRDILHHLNGGIDGIMAITSGGGDVEDAAGGCGGGSSQEKGKREMERSSHGKLRFLEEAVERVARVFRIPRRRRTHRSGRWRREAIVGAFPRYRHSGGEQRTFIRLIFQRDSNRDRLRALESGG